jgi:hypothetical protein
MPSTTATATVDEIITAITHAATMADAAEIMRTVPGAMVRTVADQLHIEADGHGLPWLRRAAVQEARAGMAEVPAEGRPATDALAASTCPAEWGPAHKWLVMASCHGPASPYGCQHCPATATGAMLGIPSEDEMRAAVTIAGREDYERACAAGGSWMPGRTIPSTVRTASAAETPGSIASTCAMGWS